MSKGGRYTKHNDRHPRRRSGGMTVLIIFLILLVLVVAGLIGGIVYRTAMERMAPAAPEVTVPPVTAGETEAVIQSPTEDETEPTT